VATPNYTTSGDVTSARTASTIVPAASTTQIAVSSDDTSNPASPSWPLLCDARGGAHRPRSTIADGAAPECGPQPQSGDLSRRLLGQAPRVAAALHHLDAVRRRIVEIRCHPDLALSRPACRRGGSGTSRATISLRWRIVACSPAATRSSNSDSRAFASHTFTSMPEMNTTPRTRQRPETKWSTELSRDHRRGRGSSFASCVRGVVGRPPLRRRRYPSPLLPLAERRRCSAGRCRRPCACRCGAGSRPAF